MKKARKYTGAYGATRRLKNKSRRIARMLRGFQQYKEGEIPKYLEKGISGKDRDTLVKMVNQII